MSDDTILLTRRNILFLSSLAGGMSFASPALAQFGGLGKVGKALEVGKDVVKAETLSQAQLNATFDQIAAQYDQDNPVAGPKTPYGKRLALLSKGLENHDGMKLDIKAYLVKDINAFAMGNGTVRIFAGLMDKFTDDEVRYVIAHEMGHVKNGDSVSRMKNALRLSAATKGLSMAGGGVGRIASSELGGLFEKVVSAQHSQSAERKADDYALNFLKTKGYQQNAAVTALDKLTALSGGGGGGLPWLNTHPSPKDRAKRMRSQISA